jgi:hypothetical protein
MTNKEFSMVDYVERALSRWWLVVALMFAGGLIGWVLHLFLPPEYEARAVISINIDFPKRVLTQFEEDNSFNAASAVISSTSVMNLVIADAQINGLSITPLRFQRDFYLEGRQSVWELRVRDRDPNVAATLTNIWAQRATDALNGALAHALQADQLLVQITGLENCLAGATPQGVSPQLDCKSFSQDAIQVMLKDQAAALVKEKISSMGILSIMTFSLTSQAEVPGFPVIYGQAGLVLAGAFIGLLVSIWAVNNLKVWRHD